MGKLSLIAHAAPRLQARLRAADIAANSIGEAQNQAAQRQSAELQLEHKTRALGLNLSPLPWT